jgi:hypothetical protein
VGVVCLAGFVPEALGADFDRTGLTSGAVDPAAIAEAAGVSTWLSWVVNLLVAEWWLHRTRNRRGAYGTGRRASPSRSGQLVTSLVAKFAAQPHLQHAAALGPLPRRKRLRAAHRPVASTPQITAGPGRIGDYVKAVLVLTHIEQLHLRLYC